MAAARCEGRFQVTDAWAAAGAIAMGDKRVNSTGPTDQSHMGVMAELDSESYHW